MNNILYIGPYRQNTLDGLLSRQLINNITQKHENVVLKPLYLEDADTSNIGPLESLEDKTYNQYNTIIQHADTNTIIPIQTVKNNIAIPIINNLIISNRQITVLSQFNKILVFNDLDYNQLSQHPKLKNKTHKYNFDIKPPDTKQKINVGLYNKFKKIYTILPNDSNAILNTVTAFNLFNAQHKYVLLLFIDRITPEDKKALDANISNLCQNMQTLNSQRIITFKSEPNLETLFAIHNSGDIYLSDERSIVSTRIAELLNVNTIKCDANLYDVSVFYNNNYFPGGVNSLSANTIKTYLTKSDFTKNKKHSKVNHINNLI